MNDQTQTATSQMTDPLDTNVNDIDTGYPILPGGYYTMKLDGCKKEPNKAGTGDNLIIPHKTVDKVQDKKGSEVNAGHTTTSYIGLTETPKYSVNDIKKRVAALGKAAGVNATVRQIIDNPAMLDGKIINRVKIKVNRETDEFPESNSVAGYGDNA